MFSRKDRNQCSFFEDKRRFVVRINPDNRWVKLAELTPWDRIEDYYAQRMSADKGREGFTSRIAFGSIYAKEHLGVTDGGVVEAIQENPYLQYYLGLPDYQGTPLFNPSMMVHFRKRFTTEFIAQVNDYICTGNWPDDDDNDSVQSVEDLPPAEETEHKGRLALDATVAPSDIRYPNDVLLLNECRENCERIIERLYEEGGCAGRKTPYKQKNVHKKTINFIKRKKKSKAFIRSSLKIQLAYLEMAIRRVTALVLLCGLDCFTEGQWNSFDVICQIYLQQKFMYDNNTNRCEGKIMSLKQPFVRAILRNKARAKYEYGQKLALSKANGHVFIEHQSWENFNECNTLQQSVLNYYRRFSAYPEVVLADQIYHTRANMTFCKKYGIRLAGMGKTRKNAGADEKKLAYKDQCDRNEIEGVNGVLKRKGGLDLIMCWLQHNAEVEASLQILALNLRSRLRLLFASFFLFFRPRLKFRFC